MGAFNVLDSEHHDVLDQAVHNLLDTDVALETFAQIIDGLPLASSAARHYWILFALPDMHPVSQHRSLCPGAMESMRNFRSRFALRSLIFDDELLGAYQSAARSEPSFQLRLIELVTEAVHQIAARLFKKSKRIHDEYIKSPNESIKALTSWKPQCPKHQRLLSWDLPDPPPTLFLHIDYARWAQYPKGVADVVGYWAESRIFGGVVLFDRSSTWGDKGEPEPNFFLHTDFVFNFDRAIWQVSDEQQQALVDLLTSALTATSPSSTLPLVDSGESLRYLRKWNAHEEEVYRGHTRDPTLSREDCGVEERGRMVARNRLEQEAGSDSKREATNQGNESGTRVGGEVQTVDDRWRHSWSAYNKNGTATT